MANIDTFFDSGPGIYLKLKKDHTTKLRLLSNLAIGWEGWYNNKPVRFKADYDWPSKEINTLDIDTNNYPKKKQYMAVVVWNYDEGVCQIWEITQKTIVDAILQLRGDKEWGGLTNHDIKVTRKGEGLETKYTVMPSPGEITPEIKEAYEKSGLAPEQLLSDTKNIENVNAFRQAAGTLETKDHPEINPEDMPF